MKYELNLGWQTPKMFAFLKKYVDKRLADVKIGSISAALSCLVYPPREETAGAWAANHVCDVNS